MLNVRATVMANNRLADNLWQLVVRAPFIAREALPGQYVHLRLNGQGEHVLRRPLSLHDVYADRRGDFDYVSLLYQVVGAGTETLSRYRIEDTLELLGPQGRGWQVPEGTRRALLVGGGVGYAPLMLLAGDLHAQGIEVLSTIGMRNKDLATAFYGGSSKRSYAFRDAVGSGRVREAYATDDGSFGHQGLVTELSEHFLREENFDYVAACGPEPMMRTVAAQVRQARERVAAEGGSDALAETSAASSASLATLPVCEVSLERRMACGLGACLSCVVPTHTGLQRACVDGPVFAAEEVVWS